MKITNKFKQMTKIVPIRKKKKGKPTNSLVQKIISFNTASLRGALFSMIPLLPFAKEQPLCHFIELMILLRFWPMASFPPVLENPSVKIRIDCQLQSRHSALKSLRRSKLCSEGNWSGCVWHNEEQPGSIWWIDTVILPHARVGGGGGRHKQTPWADALRGGGEGGGGKEGSGTARMGAPLVPCGVWIFWRKRLQQLQFVFWSWMKEDRR